MSGQLHAPAALSPWKDPRYALDRRLGGPQSRSGHLGEGKFLTVPELELRPLRRPTRSQSPYRLRYLGASIYKIPNFVIHSERKHAGQPNP
jgi:hypothetical protein